MTRPEYVFALEDLRMGMGYPVYLIARRVAQDAKVVLSGTGGDEYHAGYLGRYQSLGLVGAPSSRPWWQRLGGRLPRDGGFTSSNVDIEPAAWDDDY